MHRHRLILFILLIIVIGATTASGAALIGTATAAGAPKQWKLGPKTETGVSGVSPGVLKIGSTTYLYPTTHQGMQVWQSSDGTQFTQVADAKTPKGADASVVTLPDGTYRMYYAQMIGGPAPVTPGQTPSQTPSQTPGSGTPGQAPGQAPAPASGPKKKAMYSATSADGINWTDEAGVRIDDAGIGVPDVVTAPNGTLLATWVSLPTDTAQGTTAGNCSGKNGPPEILNYATSADGLTFTTASAPLLTGGFVDPNFARAKKNDWVMIASTGPSSPPQRLCVATSKNLTQWKVQKRALTPSSEPSFDPVAVAKGKGFTLYYSYGDMQPSAGNTQPSSSNDPPIVVATLKKK